MTVEDFVTDAVEAAPLDVAERFAREARAFVSAMRASPLRYGEPAFELRRQAFVRHIDDDPSWPLWLAWARQIEVAAAFAELVADIDPPQSWTGTR